MTREEAIKILIDCEKKPNWKITSGMIKEACRTATLHAQPAKLDRSRWEGCFYCIKQGCDTCIDADVAYGCEPCSSCKGYTRYRPVNFCRHCGRPITEEALAKLAQKIGGNDSAHQT